MKLSTVGVAVLSALVSTTVTAEQNQQVANQSDDIEHIIVTASPFAQKLSDTPNSVFIVSEEDLDLQRVVARNLSEMISNLVPGFSPSTETMSTFGQNFRGGKAIVMIDGVLISTTLRAGGRDLQSISVDVIESIEVIKGASAMHGNGEAGAIINVITKKPSVNFEMQTRVGVEAFADELSDAGYSISQSFSGTTDSDLGYLLNLSGKDRGNLYDSNGDQLPGAPNNQGGMGDADEYDVLLKLEQEFESSRLAMLAHHYYIENKLHYKRTVNEENGLIEIDKSEPYVGPNPFTKLSTVQLTYDKNDFFSQQLSLSAYYSKVNVGYESASEIVSTRSGFKAAMQWTINDRSRLAYGFEYGKDNTEQGRDRDVLTGIDADGNPITQSQYICSVCDLTETKLSPFAQYWNQVTDELTLQVGLRYENFEIEVHDYMRYSRGLLSAKQGDTLKYDKPLVNLGLVYNIAASTDIFVSYSQGYSHADMRMLRDMPVDSVAEFADEIPATQTNYYETGLRYSDDSLQGSLSFFYSDIKDGYAYDYNVDSQADKRVAAVIVADEEVWGFEATLDYQINQEIKFGTSVSMSEGKRTNSETGDDYWMNGTRITPIKASIYGDYRFNDIASLRLQANYVGDRDKHDRESDAGYSFYESPYDGYTLVDLVSTFDTDFGRFTFGIDNLLDEDYQPLVSQMNKEVIWETYRSQFSGYGRRLALEYSINY
ncbi:TonB-dependent receptor [Shewanella pneumatophori]|uniref:TonB-dependent receptor n=1 Tax=Shewanella pneumatophori TaxID=314092 RepID=A0A9X2CDY5_9GAMM|nr:TonB-dependent receptor [Shewanella pneumatophori]